MTAYGRNAGNWTLKNTERKQRFRPTRITSEALEILDHYVIGDDANLRDDVKEAEFEFEVAQLIYDARTAAGLTQADVAELIGSNQSVISRLEGADYDGHSLSMLRRIADALDQRLEINFGPNGRPDLQSG